MSSGIEPGMAASRPTVTVIVCTFNRIQWLEKCLRSLEQQDVRADEIMVVDGPSTDGSREMLEELERKGSIVLVRQAKLDGISAARNMGLRMAKGDVVCYIDDDAVAQPGWLSSILSLYGDPKVGGVGGPVMDMTGKLTMGKNAVAPDGRWFDESRGESTDGLSQVMVGCNMSFRREALLKIGGFDPYFRYHQDETDACLGVLHAGYSILYHEGAVVWHEWCEGSYRKDRIKWYLRLRYMWGRNTAYMVRKHFSERMGFSGYLGAQVGGFVQRRAPQEAAAPAGDIKKEEPMPRFFVAMGMFSEFFGIFRGWRDGGSAR
jgi:GT2 family glycosyltransferase